jgi:hypothetical protein
MKVYSDMSLRTDLPLPAFVLHPLTAVSIAVMHVYLAAGHLLKLIGGEVTWTKRLEGLWRGCRCLCVRGPCITRAREAKTPGSTNA